MDPAELMEKTKKAIRALLISAPRGVPARLFLVDYRKVMGKELPFRNLGFRSVDDFICGIPDVVKVGMGATGEPTLFPVVTAQTSQIARFVATQKKPKLKRSYMPPSTTAPSRAIKMSGFSNKSSSYGRSRTKSSTKSFHQQRYLLNPPVQSYVSRGYAPPPPQRRGRIGSTPSYNSVLSDASRSVSTVTRSLIGTHVQAYAPKWYAPPPTRRGRIGSTPSYTSAVNETTVGLGSLSIEPRSPIRGPKWKDEYSKAQYLSIDEMRIVKNTLAYNTVRTIGYICTPYRIDKVNAGIKYLLYSDLSLSEMNPADGRGIFPAVMLYFNASVWNKQEHPELGVIKPATKLLVYGKPFRQVSAKNGKEEPALLVYYYEVVSRGATSSSPQFRSATVPSSVQPNNTRQVRTTTSVSSSSSSQWGSCPSTPPVGFVSGSLKQTILTILDSHSDVRVSQLEKLYSDKTGTNPPNSLLEITESLPGVVCRRDAQGMLVYSLKQSVTGSSSIISQRSDDLSRAGTPPAGFVSGSLKQKIFKLLEEKSYGVYVKHLPKVFEMKYKSEAPMNLAEMIKSLDFVKYEEEIPGHPVVYLKTGASPPTPVLPSSVEFDSDTEIFDVTITFINSVTSFHVQMIGSDYSDKFREMMQKMNGYLGKHAQRPKHPVAVDVMYGLLWDDGCGDDDKIWCRAVVGSLSDNKVQVLFPDYGNSDLVDVHALRELPPPFYQLPFQAVQCCLHGLTDDDEVNSQFNELITFTETSYTAQVMDRCGSRVSVELMDSDPSIHETINSILLKATHPISTLEPYLPELGEPMVPVKLTDIDLEGVIALQVQGPGLNQLQQLMTIINDTYLDKETGPNDRVTDIKKGSLYCAQYEGKWYRVEVTKIISLKQVTVHYVDYGNEDDLLANDLRAPIKNELFSLPFQAVKCTLAGLPPEGGKWTEAAINHLWDKEENLNVSVVESGSGGALPSVTLTLCADGEELNLNQWLAEQTELFFDREEPFDEPQLAEISCITSIPVSTSDGTLFSPHTPQSTPSPATHFTPPPPPQLSTMPCASLTLSELSKVMLSWTESPSNFVVQLSDNLQPLEEMMTALNKALASPDAPPPSSLTTGQLCCATCSIDGRWYRAVIVGIDSTNVTVEFVDYGGREEVLSSSLRALPPHSSSYSYPLQGIKCTLHGIKPTGGQWSPEASHFFNEFAEKEYYVFCKQLSDEGSSIIILINNVQINDKMVSKGFAYQ